MTNLNYDDNDTEEVTVPSMRAPLSTRSSWLDSTTRVLVMTRVELAMWLVLTSFASAALTMIVRSLS